MWRRLLWGGPSGEIPWVRMRGRRHPVRRPCPSVVAGGTNGGLVHPLQRLRAARDRHRGRKPCLPSLPNRTAVEKAITPGGSTARRSRWNGGCDLRRGPARADPPGRRPQQGGAVQPAPDRSPYGVTVTKDVQAGGNCAVGLRRSDVVARNSVRRDNAVRASGEREVFIDEAALPWTLRDAASLSRMGVCAFAPFGWRLHGGGVLVLRAGGEPCRWLPSGGRLHGGCVLPLGGRSGWTLPRSRRWLAGIGPARSCPSCWRHQRGCSRAHDNAFAGGAVCLELGSPCLSLPDRSASERALRAGVAVDGRCAAGWRWRSVEPAGGAEEPGPSLCLKGGSGRAFCLGRRMGVCWHSPSGRWPQGEGRSAVWCGGRWRVLPLGRMKRVGLQVEAGRVMPMWIRATRRQALGCQAAGGRASGLVAGGLSDEGRMGRRQSTTGRPLCWRQDEAAAVCQVAIRVPGFLLEAAGNSPSSRRLHAGGRCAALGSNVRQEGVQMAGGGAAAGKQARAWAGGSADDAAGLEACGERPRRRR